MDKLLQDILMEVMQSFLGSDFPKQCESCGKRYKDLREFLGQTAAVPHGSSFLRANDCGDKSIVDILRNCVCGTTLMVVIRERRDTSERGMETRAAFGQLLDTLIANGADRNVARQELLRFMRGQDSSFLRAHGLPGSLAELGTTSER